MKFFTAFLASFLLLCSTATSFGFGFAEKKSETEMDCSKSCCEKSHHQKSSSDKENKSCCNDTFCSFSCNSYLAPQHSSIIKSFAQIIEIPKKDLTDFILNKFITDVFQPPEAETFTS